MNNTEQQEFQALLKQKQKFIQKAIEAINKQDKELAIKFINLDAGFNIELIKILGGEHD